MRAWVLCVQPVAVGACRSWGRVKEGGGAESTGRRLHAAQGNARKTRWKGASSKYCSRIWMLHGVIVLKLGKFERTMLFFSWVPTYMLAVGKKYTQGNILYTVKRGFESERRLLLILYHVILWCEIKLLTFCPIISSLKTLSFKSISSYWWYRNTFTSKQNENRKDYTRTIFLAWKLFKNFFKKFNFLFWMEIRWFFFKIYLCMAFSCPEMTRSVAA